MNKEPPSTKGNIALILAIAAVVIVALPLLLIRKSPSFRVNGQMYLVGFNLQQWELRSGRVWMLDPRPGILYGPRGPLTSSVVAGDGFALGPMRLIHGRIRWRQGQAP